MHSFQMFVVSFLTILYRSKDVESVVRVLSNFQGSFVRQHTLAIVTCSLCSFCQMRENTNAFFTGKVRKYK